MDKDRLAPGPCSWLEVHNFIGDLMTASASVSGPLREQRIDEPLSSAWDMARPKVSNLSQSNPSRQRQVKNTVGFGLHSEEREKQPRDHESLVQHHTCTCPGCPLSSSLSSSLLQSLKPRSNPASQIQPPSPPQSSSSQQVKEPNSAPVALGLCLGLGLSLEEGTVEATSTSNSEPGRPQHQDKSTSTHSPIQQSNHETPNVQAFPCLCCHRGFQTCSQLLRHQKDAGVHAGHYHHHQHGHHCPLTSCMPCTQLHHAAQSLSSYPCLSCQRTFPTCAQLLRHQQCHVQQDGLQHLTCMHCSASFPRPSQLLQHQRAEHASKTGGFMCAECGRAFNSHSNLRIHLNVHSGARPYSCVDCGKSFSQSGALKIHRRIHTGERPYTCSYCGRGFPHLAGVRAHQRTHTGEKPYQCSQCGKSFTQSGALKIHTRIHTGERPFICSLCGKSFSNRSGIRFHHRTVHGIVTEPNSVGRPSLAVTASSPASDLQRIQTSGQEPLNLLNLQQLDGRSPSSKKQITGESDKRALPYACEDCGQRFPDAPTRNRHQTLEHYSAEEREREDRSTDNNKD
nr:zinc finger protein ZFP2 isoform X1 [Misgurnus anguillicaudatus]